MIVFLKFISQLHVLMWLTIVNGYNIPNDAHYTIVNYISQLIYVTTYILLYMYDVHTDIHTAYQIYV